MPAPSRSSIPRLVGLGLVLALVASACGMNGDPAAQSYGGEVAKPPKFVRGAGGARLGEQRDHPVRRAKQEQQQTAPAQIVTAPLPRPADELGFIWPVGSEAQITSLFGWRIDPIRETRSFHHGTDIGCWQGQAIVSSNGGQVMWAGRARIYGYAVVITHGYGLMTVYGHMQKTLVVQPGQRIERGQMIGTCGSGGGSNGPHLHFEVRHGNTVYDPLGFLP